MAVWVLKQRAQVRDASLSELLGELDGPYAVPGERVVPPRFEQGAPVWEICMFAQEKCGAPPGLL